MSRVRDVNAVANSGGIRLRNTEPELNNTNLKFREPRLGFVHDRISHPTNPACSPISSLCERSVVVAEITHDYWGSLREIKQSKNLSEGDIQERTGQLRCYVSRVENGHTIPAMETLDSIAHALEMHLYQVFYEGDDLPPLPPIKRVHSTGRCNTI